MRRWGASPAREFVEGSVGCGALRCTAVRSIRAGYRDQTNSAEPVLKAVRSLRAGYRVQAKHVRRVSTAAASTGRRLQAR